jgi:hypothetical protein
VLYNYCGGLDKPLFYYYLTGHFLFVGPEKTKENFHIIYFYQVAGMAL